MADELPITAQMLKDLRKLEESGWIGCARGRGAWRGTGGNIGLHDAPMLTQARLARKVYKGRAPRIVITERGRKLLASRERRSDA
ncbi:hypothetical protein [Aureimonas mangrovi]|uniref:hypothetical protein n=1 Tax=Aureimonas mangrovi TaxID=2758041 RepID=UPI00163DAEB2|nr:hypothetical protein [Aureimonas mangrovi]